MQAIRRVAFVTGGARGIGRSIALRLASDGLDIAVNDHPSASSGLRETVDQLREKGVRAISVEGDVSDEANMRANVDEVVQKLGAVDVAVANAGVNDVKPFLAFTTQDFDRIFSINVRGVFNTYKVCGTQMIEQGRGGKLIAAASIAGLIPFKLMATYCATKFAVRGLNQGGCGSVRLDIDDIRFCRVTAAALELGAHKITCNCYCPGIVDTPMWKLIDASFHELEGVPKGEIFKTLSKAIPLGRSSVPEDVANLVSYLASPGADYMTGQSITVDGGIRMS